MRKTLLPALACSLAAFGLAGAALANPPAAPAPVEHPAPHPDGDHHEGTQKPAGH